ADPKVRAEGDKLLNLAADAYDGIALYARAKRTLAASPDEAASSGALHDLAVAGKLLRHPLAKDDPRIQAIEVKLPLPRRALDLRTVDWDLAAKALGGAPPVSDLAAPDVKSCDPYIAIFPRFLSEEECDFLIALANPHLRPSQVTDPITGKYISIDYRTSHDMRFWHVFQDLAVFCINLRIAKASAEPLSHQEMLGVLRYHPGEEYKPHGDFLTPDAQGKNAEVERSGQRTKTFLTYLNADYEGGETEFIKLGLKVKGAKGDGLLFRNVTEAGAPDERTIHAGLPITQGVKWLSTIWIRAREYRYRD
ncbi:MAG TPA: 2OG-Fe(II) oxygenase, partial [Sphingomonadales bacterium]|nr:2OG-Fe(II) oxygenase [Sphingomonadales bacterium]